VDQFTRRYLYILSAVVIVGFLLWLSNLDPRVGELNDILESDEQLATYPYQFRVLSLDQGVARMTSPRSAQMSAIQGLRIMFPELEGKSPVSPEMIAAQERLASIQTRAAGLVKAQEDVRSVRWTLDERWLTRNGVSMQ
jgi:hypothetical protein